MPPKLHLLRILNDFMKLLLLRCMQALLNTRSQNADMFSVANLPHLLRAI